MENQKLDEWQRAVDRSEENTMISDLPTVYPLGGHMLQPTDSLPRDWQMLEVASGRVGARWCYWFPWTTKNPHSGVTIPGIGPNPENKVIADTIFNGDAPHFVGMLGVPYAGVKNTPAWVLISPRMIPPPEQKIVEEKSRERYERSRDVYDVDTQKTHRLP